MKTSMGIREIAEKVGVTAHTLRYYEAAGLMLDVPRDGTGRRVYDDEHVRWVAFLLRLREGGMGIAQIRAYAELIRSGKDPDGTHRRGILREHRDEVRERIERLRDHLEVLERKVSDGCAPEVTATPPDGERP